MVSEKPFIGFGANQFEANYMHYQARYLDSHFDSREAILADNTIYAFNGFLRVIIEEGLLGFLLFGALIISVFYRLKEPLRLTSTPKYVRSLIVSLCLFALFSYPSSIYSLRILFIVFIAIQARYQVSATSIKISLNKLWSAIIKITVIVPLLLISYFAIQHGYLVAYSVYQWKTANTEFEKGHLKPSIQRYETIYPNQRANYYFLVMFANLLKLNNQYNESISVFDESLKIIPTSDVYYSIGECYDNQHRYMDAEKNYRYALQMVPSKIKPILSLAIIYANTDRRGEAIELIDEYLDRKWKKRTYSSFEIELKLIELRKNLLIDF